MQPLLADDVFTWGRFGRRVLFLSTRQALRLGGFAAARPLGAAMAALHYRFGRATRRQCQQDLARLLGRDAADPLVKRTLREAYRVNTRAVLEVLSMVDRQLDAATLQSRCHTEGLHHLEAARTGRGAILLATHSGNSLLLAAQLAQNGVPVTVVYRHARMVDALRHNRVLFAMVDQGVRQAETGLEMEFLGKRMPMPGGVMQLARQTRAPIVPVEAVAADPVWRFQMHAPLVFQPGGTLEQDMAILLRETERQILAHPQLWSWQQRRWRGFAMAGDEA